MPRDREVCPYPGETTLYRKNRMAKRIQWADEPNFGARMAKLRKAASYTQRELAAALGISHRMVAYYESQSNHPPGGLLPRLADVLGVSTDELLGVGASLPKKRIRDARLQRCIEEADQLPAKQRRQILEFVEALVERDRLKNGTTG